jgi:hypothetical protein
MRKPCLLYWTPGKPAGKSQRLINQMIAFYAAHHPDYTKPTPEE